MLTALAFLVISATGEASIRSFQTSRVSTRVPGPMESGLEAKKTVQNSGCHYGDLARGLVPLRSGGTVGEGVLRPEMSLRLNGLVNSLGLSEPEHSFLRSSERARFPRFAVEPNREAVFLAVRSGSTRVPNSSKVTIWGVGDVMLARWVGRRIEREGPDSPFIAFHKRFVPGLGDIFIGNLECAVTDKPVAAFKPIDLRAKPDAIPGLTYAGFSLLSLANNHAGDCGSAGLIDTAARLSRAGITPLGPTATPIYKTVNRLRLAFIGLTDLPGYPLAPDWEAQVKAARQRADVVTVMMHWGIEETFPEDRRQRDLAQRLANDGVDVILGCHPHVLQPIKTLQGSSGRRCLVVYSLGNFVFDAKPGLQSRSELIRVVVSAKGFDSYKVTPLSIVHGAPTSPRVITDGQATSSWHSRKDGLVMR